MAAVTKNVNKISYIAPDGYGAFDAGYPKTDIEKGDPIEIVADTPPSRQTDCVIQKSTGTACHGFAVKSVKAGAPLAEFATQGEIEGFAGMTPGAGLTIVSGALDDTAPAAGVTTQIRAVTPTRIRFVVV